MSEKVEETMEMNNETQNDIIKVRRAKKMMLWFGIVSLGMSFAGITSAYVISKERPDWLTDFEIPQAFYLSLIVIILSSVTMHFANKSIKAGESKGGMILLCTTFLLGLSFTYLQFRGFSEIIANGYYFTGSESTITTSFIYLVVILHLTHIISALICVLVVIYNHYKQKYVNGNTLGVELATTFWHFVDFLWIYLFLFFYFVR